MLNRMVGGFIAGVLGVAGAQTNQAVLDSITVPDGFSVSQAAGSDLSAYPMFMALDDGGRLFIAESTGKDLSGKEMAAAPECLILRLTDDDGDGVFDSKTVFADTLSLPMGVLCYRGAVYVASPPDLIRFEDTDDDGVADQREVLLSGWNVLNTASLHGPFLGPDGWIYLTHGRHGYDITTKEGERLEGLAARIWRCRPDGTGLERYCGGGFDNPVELIFTNGGDLIGTMTYFTDPRHGQRDALMHWVYGGVYPKPHEAVNEFVRTGDLMPTMTKFSRIAPAGLAQYRGEAFGDAYKGVLFSAQFNPHRVMRHMLIREGATYRTEDADFLTSSYPDFYPTDVLEDADGSLLVSDTGAWYVDACPISRVAKPEIKGGIYRVRKDGYTPPADPRGIGIDWGLLDDASLVSWLDDPRPAVRDRAFQALALKDASPDALRDAVANAKTNEGQVMALRAVIQADGTGAAPVLAHALTNGNPDVKQTAIRAIGDLGLDATAADLERVLQESDLPHLRADAASALGRLGAKSATAGLLAAADGAHDRFEEHAIIFSLIEIGDANAIAQSLGSDAPGTGKAALIALDQLGYAGLNAQHALPLLESDDDALRNAGLWVASRHPDWAGEITAYVEGRLRADAIGDRERASLTAIAEAYRGTEAMQAALARLGGDDALDDERRLHVFDLMDRAAGALPDAWVAVIGETFDSASPTLQARALDIIRQRGLDQFDDRLNALVADNTASEAIRIAALDAVAPRRESIGADEMALLLKAVAPDADAASRSRAARILSSAVLPLDAEVQLVETAIPTADALLMLGLLTRFENRSEPELGIALIEALSAHPRVDRLLTVAQADRLFDNYPANIRKTANPLREQLSGRDEKLVARLLALEERAGTGDVGRGRRLFFGERAKCSTCHAVGEEGGTLGPDLTTIGLVRTAHDLLEAILFPSASMVPDFAPFVVETADDVYAGIIGRELPASLLLRMGADEERNIARGDILSMEPSPVSIMPEGLDAELSDEELLDLLAFLQSLNNEQWLLPERREQ